MLKPELVYKVLKDIFRWYTILHSLCPNFFVQPIGVIIQRKHPHFHCNFESISFVIFGCRIKFNEFRPFKICTK